MKKIVFVSVPMVFIALLSFLIGMGLNNKESDGLTGTGAAVSGAASTETAIIEITGAAVTETGVTAAKITEEKGKSIFELVREYAKKMKKTEGIDPFTSSPYADVNMEYYDKIVALGFGAVEILEEETYDGVILRPWIAASMIHKITRCDVGDWCSAPEFFEKWERCKDYALYDMTEIIMEDTGIDEKVEKIKKFGIFGEAFVQDILSYGEKAKMLDNDDHEELSLTDGDRERLEEIVTSDPSEIKMARKYLLKWNS